jgi:hypothetical protein
MASTFSELKFELIGSGEQSNTWGNTTNTNIGTAIEQAITGLGNPVFTSDTNLTIDLTDLLGPALQTARALVLNATSVGSLTATRELIVPTIEKQYLVHNNTSGGQSITVKTSAGTGITVPNGAEMHLYVNGVNVIDAVTHFSALTLGAALPVTSGGTGTATPALVQGTNVTITGTWPNQTINAAAGNLTGAVTSLGLATSLGSFTSANLSAALTDETGSGAAVFATSPTLVTPALGTPSALVGTNITGTAAGLTAGNVTTNANLTGAVTSTGNATVLGSFTSANLAAALTDETGSGAAVFATSPTLVTPALGTPTSGNLDSCTADGTNKVGYRNVPASGTKTSSYTLVAADVGKFVELGTGGSVVVPAAVFAAGDVVSIFNNTSATIACTCSAVTDVYKAGTDADISSFSITTRGVATVLFITATRAVVSGNLA